MLLLYFNFMCVCVCVRAQFCLSSCYVFVSLSHYKLAITFSFHILYVHTTHYTYIHHIILLLPTSPPAPPLPSTTTTTKHSELLFFLSSPLSTTIILSRRRWLTKQPRPGVMRVLSSPATPPVMAPSPSPMSWVKQNGLQHSSL